jgi:stage II sporulation protein D
MKCITLILGLLLGFRTFAGDPLLIGILQQTNCSRADVRVISGAFSILDGDIRLCNALPGQLITVSNTGNGATSVESGERSWSCQNAINFRGIGEFSVTPGGQKASGRIYSGELIIRPVSGLLSLINRVELEAYVPGVIEAEAGDGRSLEYYKVQAIISRTYALNNTRRHLAEGYNLCDGTHCQVYHGRPRFVHAGVEATAATRDVVIVDDEINLITAAFHSNCGGHTVNAEHVWSKPLSYCVGRPDTFCLVMPHSNWEKSIPLHQWTNYLQSKRYPLSDSLTTSALAYFPAEKEVFFVDQSFHIPLRTIRSDLKLRSAFFTVHQEGESVTFIGQGFGHGVGLCQEGAMRMAELGYSYQDIIHYYYHNVHLVPKRFLWFFRED